MAGKPREPAAVTPRRKRRRDDMTDGDCEGMIPGVRRWRGLISRGNCRSHFMEMPSELVLHRNPAQLKGFVTVYSSMKAAHVLWISILAAGLSLAQGPRPDDLGASPQPVGEAGVAWYTTWETALEEAERSNRPIFFMAAAATCSGISGVF